ncbi:MAG: GNAT family N-acetyltransferase [Chloroflexi bacterium]|nr:GNAT family N-acetyltransferase [Chloroflexota bacterium]
MLRGADSEIAQSISIEIQPTRTLPEEVQNHIGEWMHRIFAGMDVGIEWAGGDWSILVHVNGELVSHVNIVDRVVRVGGRDVRLGGIGNVATLETWQGRGLASIGMRTAQAFMCDELGVDFGLLLCEEDLIPFYRRLGWQVVSEPAVVDQPGGKVTLHHIVMVISCQQSEWPSGAIDLCGLPW